VHNNSITIMLRAGEPAIGKVIMPGPVLMLFEEKNHN
jgi:hypothetical protein